MGSLDLATKFPITEHNVRREFGKAISVGLAEKSVWTPFMTRSGYSPINTDILGKQKLGGYTTIRFKMEGSDSHAYVGDTRATGRQKKQQYLFTAALTHKYGIAYEFDQSLELDKAYLPELEKERADALQTMKEEMALILDVMIFRELLGIDYFAFPHKPTAPTNQYTCNSGVGFGGTTAPTDTLSVEDVRNLVKIARDGYRDPLTGSILIPPIMPIREVRINLKGITVVQPYYVMLVNPTAALQLKEDPQWESAVQSALPRGWDNPFFSGILGIIDGCILIQCETELATPHGIVRAGLPELVGNDGVTTGTNLFLGRNALGLRRNPVSYREWLDENKFGNAASEQMFAIKKLNFEPNDRYPDSYNSIFANKDLGHIAVYNYISG